MADLINVARRTEINRPKKQTSETKLSTANTFVRFVGFEPIPDGRQLRFRVKSKGEPAVEVTCAVADATFTGIAKISIQDAAPMAYEKLVQLFQMGRKLETTRLFLTMADIREYMDRHALNKRAA